MTDEERKQKYYEKKLKELNEAIILNPDNIMYYRDKSSLLENINLLHDEVIAVWDEYIANCPNDDSGYLRKFGALTRRGKHKEAVDVCNEWLKLQPDEWKKVWILEEFSKYSHIFDIKIEFNASIKNEKTDIKDN